MFTLIALTFLSVLAFMAHRSLESLRQRRWEWVASDASELAAMTEQMIQANVNHCWELRNGKLEMSS